MNNSRKKRFYITLLLFLVVNQLTQSQQQKISLEEAIITALHNNVAIKKSENNFKEAKNTSFTSYVDLFPKAEFYSDAFKSIGNNFDDITGQLRTSSGEFVNTNLTVSWDILKVFQKYANLNYAKHNKAFNSWNLESVKDQISLDVIRLYLEILQNQDQGKVLDEFLKAQKTNLEQTNEMIRLGTLAGQDRFLQKVELSRLESARIENISLINRKKNQLLLLLGIKVDTPIALVSPQFQVDQFAYLSKASVDSLYNDAIVKRNDLKSKEFEVKSIKDQWNVRKSNYYPDINVFYRYGTGYSSFQETNFNDQYFSNNIFEAYGAQITIPILKGNKVRNEVYKARMAYETAKLDYEQFTNTIYTQLSNNKNDLALGLEELNYRESQLESAKNNYDLIQQKYFLQASSSQELVIAYRDNIEAELVVNQTRYQLIFNYYQMQYNLGSLRNLFE